MVTQTRHLIDTTDIIQLRLRCRLRPDDQPCDGEILLQLGPLQSPPSFRCPRCGESWTTQFPDAMPIQDRQRPQAEAATLALIDAIRTLTGGKGAMFGVVLEVDGEQGRES